MFFVVDINEGTYPASALFLLLPIGPVNRNILGEVVECHFENHQQISVYILCQFNQRKKIKVIEEI